jgi:hypothetical protein
LFELAVQHSAVPGASFQIASSSPFGADDLAVLCRFLDMMWTKIRKTQAPQYAADAQEEEEASAADAQRDASAAAQQKAFAAAAQDEASAAQKEAHKANEASAGVASDLQVSDLKVVVGRDQLRCLLACADNSADNKAPLERAAAAAAVVAKLLALYQHTDADRNAKFAMRMVGPTAACIPFHCDGDYAYSTTQIALNSDYSGGRLVYFVLEKPSTSTAPNTVGTLHVLDRPANTLTHHPPKVLHGVTRLLSGTRKSFFVLDEANGLMHQRVCGNSASSRVVNLLA